MREENLQEAEIIRLKQWHSNGYTGKGIKVMSFENLQKGYGDEHGYHTLGAFKQSAPNAEIFEPDVPYSKSGTSCFEDTVQQAIDNGVDIIFNALHFGITKEKDIAIRKAIDAGIIIVNALGNENEYREDYTNKKKYYDNRNYNGFIQIGAVQPTKHNGIQRLPYSNKGKLLQYVAFTNIYTEDGKRFTGTSCATPWFAGVLACLLQFMKENNIPKSRWQEIVDDHLVDLGEAGRDDLYGKGMLVLPDLGIFDVNKYTNNKIILQIGNNKMQVGDKTIKLDVAPKIENGRTLVPLRAIGEALGFEFEWKDETKTIIITKRG